MDIPKPEFCKYVFDPMVYRDQDILDPQYEHYLYVEYMDPKSINLYYRAAIPYTQKTVNAIGWRFKQEDYNPPDGDWKVYVEKDIKDLTKSISWKTFDGTLVDSYMRILILVLVAYMKDPLPIRIPHLKVECEYKGSFIQFAKYKYGEETPTIYSTKLVQYKEFMNIS